MKDASREQLSAFLDDELDGGETEFLVRRLSADADLRGAAVRYAVIGDAIRDELVTGDPRAMVREVSLEIASKEVVQPVAEPASRSGLLKVLGGSAVAASVAVMAVLSLSTNDESSPAPAQVTVPEPAPVLVSPVSASQPGIARAGSPTQLRRYYLNHSQYASTLGGQGYLIRVVRTPEMPAEEDESEDPDGRKIKE